MPWLSPNPIRASNANRRLALGRTAACRGPKIALSRRSGLMPLNQRHEFTHVLESCDFCRGKARVERTLHRQHQSHVTHAIPFGDVVGSQLWVDHEIIIAKNFLK